MSQNNNHPSQSPSERAENTTTIKAEQSLSNDSKESAFKSHPIWLVAVFIIGTFLGHGAIWEWKASKLDAKELDIKQNQSKLTNAIRTTELRSAQIEIFREIIEISNKYSDIRDKQPETKSQWADNNKMLKLELRLELDLLTSNFLTLEKQLAELERREPRPIEIYIIPPSPPTGLHISQSPSERAENTTIIKAEQSKSHSTWLIAGVIITTLLGHGAFWKWKESKLTNAIKTTELRRNQSEIYREVIELSNKYSAIRDKQLEARSPWANNNKMIELKHQLDLLKSNFLILEEQLAELERREPRPIETHFIPPSPPHQASY